MEKRIDIYLSMKDFFSIDNSSENVVTTTIELLDMIEREVPSIETTLTHALSSEYYEKGYEIVIHSKGKLYFMSDILKNGTPDSLREIRLAHNWEKMLYSGALEIDI